MKNYFVIPRLDRGIQLLSDLDYPIKPACAGASDNDRYIWWSANYTWRLLHVY